MAGPGRETKFDEERAASILKDLANGNTRECAAERAGIATRSLYRWLARGKEGDEPFASFASRLKKAERDAERRMVGVIRRASRTSWQAAAWWLERKFPEYWGKDSETIREMIAEHKKRKADNG